MKRKKLILRIAWIAAVVLVISLMATAFEVMYSARVNERAFRRWDNRIADLTKDYQEYLDGIAQQIAKGEVDQNLITQINSYVNNRQSLVKLYLWMSDKDGKFVFGVPTAVFSNLNTIYDNRGGGEEREGGYVDRNDFLLKNIGREEEIDIIHPTRGVRFREFRIGRVPDYTIAGDIHYPGERRLSNRIVLSSPIIDAEQQVKGELYLKVNDIKSAEALARRGGAVEERLFHGVLFPAFNILLGIAALFLWLLLPSWVYIDARQRDVKRAFMWSMLTVVTLGFALAIYLVVRPAAVKSFLCPQCEKELNGSRAFCPYCGFDLAKVFCPQCEYQVQADWKFCPGCRWDLTREPQPQSEEEKEQPK
ncbi:MAG: zinc ribbon domain-containing protein [Candidatus Aminicenantes bacterium]|nr:zinc ribbon domain-containing protein [Candidatus Aminicenantes bacterium]